MSQVRSAFRTALSTAVDSPMHLTVVLVVGTAAALASVVVPLVPLLGLLAGPLFNAVFLAPVALAAMILVIGYLEAATVADSITSIYLVEYFEAAADASVLPESRGESAAPVGDVGGFEFGESESEPLSGR